MSIKDTVLIVQPAAVLAAATASPVYDLARGAVLVAGKWEPNNGGAPLKLLCPVVAYALPAGGNQTYAFVVDESPDGVSWTPASPVRTVAGDGVPATGGLMILGFFSRQRYVQLVVTPAGTAPSVTLGDCYLSPLVDAFGA